MLNNKISKQSEIIKVIRFVHNVKEIAFRYFYRLTAIDSRHVCVQQRCDLHCTTSNKNDGNEAAVHLWFKSAPYRGN